MKLRYTAFALLGLFSSAVMPPRPAAAQVQPAPALMNFQGRLAKPNGTPVSDGTYSVQFSLYDALTGGNQKWTQTISNLNVRNGSFAALLSGFPATTFNGNLWLEIKIGTAAALSPRQQMVSVAYAMKANTVPDGSIGAPQIADGGITSAKLASGVVPAALPPSGAAGGDLSGTYPNPTVAASAIGNAKLASDSASLAKVSGGVLTTSSGFITDSRGFEVDSSGLNNGTFLNALSFGLSNTGEGIASKRTAGGNQYGIDFYTMTTNRMSIANNGNVGIGTTSPSTLLTVNGEITANVVTVLGGSDVAEPYEVASAGLTKPIPGMVVTIDPDHIGQMRVASRAYDPAVAGIVSGANGIAPGITLRQKGTVADGSLPVASIGRVWCLCDADANGPIEPGDMLTTSDTPGHAMRATDRERRDGAVIGKAMSPLKAGRGMVLVLVSLK